MFKAEIVGIIKRLWPRDFPIPEPNVRNVANYTVAQELSMGLVSSPDCAHRKMILLNKSLRQQRIWQSQGFPKLLQRLSSGRKRVHES